jgi:hypothetical protein
MLECSHFCDAVRDKERNLMTKSHTPPGGEGEGGTLGEGSGEEERGL